MGWVYDPELEELRQQVEKAEREAEKRRLRQRLDELKSEEITPPYLKSKEIYGEPRVDF